MFGHAKCRSTARLDGKTAIITGCNTGIGKYNALDFCRRGCRVIMACRNVQKAEEAKADILEKLKGNENLGELVVMQLDLSSLRSVKEFTSQFLKDEQHLDLLINNAGVMTCPESKTEDGFEMQLGTNHFGHFYLTLLLLPRMLKSTPARIVNVSSSGHSIGDMNFDDLNWKTTQYSALKAYGRSKLANILFTVELAERLKGTGITVYSLHPGAVKTDLQRHVDDTYFSGLRTITSILFAFVWKNEEQGAQTQIYCALDEAAGKETGLYYSSCKVATPSRLARNKDLAKRLWEESWKLVKLEDYEPFVPN